MPVPSTLRGLLLCLVAVFSVACQTTSETKTNSDAGPKAETDPKRRATIRLQLAANYYQQRQYTVAIDETKRALQSDPDSALAYGMLGLIYMDIGDLAQAEANFGRALRLEPQNPEINNNYGWYLCRNGRERDAVPYFERAAGEKLYATPALPLQNAGICLMQVRDYRQAETFLRRSFEVDAANPVVKYQLARLYLIQRQPDRAKFYYGLLERDFEATAETLWLGLRIARQSGDPRTERQLGEQLTRKYPNSREASLLRRGVFDE